MKDYENENTNNTPADDVGNESTSNDFATNTDASSIDYEELGQTIYDNTYNALNDFYSSHDVNYMSESFTDDVFATSTDAQLYTVELNESQSSVALQELAYVLDIRNILLIFLFMYFIISIYSKLKATLQKYYERS